MIAPWSWRSATTCKIIWARFTQAPSSLWPKHAAGFTLQRHFPHLTDSVIPVLRKSELKFRRPAQSTILAKAYLDAKAKEDFELQLEKKGRATITVPVEITDQQGHTTLVGTYEWYVQKT